jgi:hypothetical protein
MGYEAGNVIKRVQDRITGHNGSEPGLGKVTRRSVFHNNDNPTLTPENTASGTKDTTPQPVVSSTPSSYPIVSHDKILVGMMDVDRVKAYLRNGPFGDRHYHASYPGPQWPSPDASILRWIYVGVTWSAGYTVFTYEDFVREWRTYDGTLLGLMEPHRLLRTFLTAGVTVALLYALPALEVLVNMTERFWYFIRALWNLSGDVWTRVRDMWREWLMFVNDGLDRTRGLIGSY